MMEKIHILLADTFKIINTLDLHRLCLYPVAVLPVGAVGRNLADIDLRIKFVANG